MAGCIIVLVLVVATIGVFFSWILPRLLDSRATERIQQEPFGKPFSILSIALAFDPDQALVWETQIPILQVVSIAGPKGISLRLLNHVYLESARHYPEVYEGFSFKKWLEFMECAQLLRCNEEHRVLLTIQGRDFLHYRITAEDALRLSPTL